jgi:nucleotide-binding universal stress UspA family protein
MNWTNNKTIVVPIDFSDESVRALDEALDMVALPSQVHVIHVMHDCDFGVSEISLGPSEREMRATQITQALRSRLADRKYKDVELRACYGDAGIEITKFAQHVKADLIVMPSHGRGGLRHLLIGSVAERVVRLAHCPVLILKAAQSFKVEKSASPAEPRYVDAVS